MENEKPVAKKHVPSPQSKAPFAHATAVIDDGSKIGNGTKVWHFSHVSSGAVIGEGCNLGQNVFVAPGVKIGNWVKIQNNVSLYEGVELEDYVFCGPSMVFTNILTPRCEFPRATAADYHSTLIKRGASIGANATIVCGITLHECAFVAAGAVVTKDVPAYAMVAGVPAKVIGWMSAYGDRLNFDKDGFATDTVGDRYQKVNDTLVKKITK
jgi:UDP-2-acetamido-3-amino-2,3-dideoxy-glucuronate N-acetyltransferase